MTTLFACAVALGMSVTGPNYVSLAKHVSRHPDIPLVVAVIAVESTFRPEVTSASNAKGLMQLLPSTANWMYITMGGKCDLLEPDLHDPARNIVYGSCYLAYLQDTLRTKDITTIALAYHSGLGNVRNNKIGPVGREYQRRVHQYYKLCGGK